MKTACLQSSGLSSAPLGRKRRAIQNPGLAPRATTAGPAGADGTRAMRAKGERSPYRDELRVFWLQFPAKFMAVWRAFSFDAGRSDTVGPSGACGRSPGRKPRVLNRRLFAPQRGGREQRKNATDNVRGAANTGPRTVLRCLQGIPDDCRLRIPEADTQNGGVAARRGILG